MKKRIWMLFAALLTAVLFAGCGEQEEDLDLQLELVAEPLPEAAEGPAESSAEDIAPGVEQGDRETEPGISTESGASTQEETLPVQKLEGEVGEWGNAYLEVIGKAAGEDENGAIAYGWIYFDGDDVPELVIDRTGYEVSLYTFREGLVYTLMDHWAYGAGGNAGYEYLPGENLLRNYNSDYAGMVLYTTYMEMTDAPELALKYYIRTAYEDGNGNVLTPESDEDMVEENWHFYLSENGTDEREITAEEMATYLIQKDFEAIQGTMTAEQIEEQLKQ